MPRDITTTAHRSYRCSDTPRRLRPVPKHCAVQVYGAMKSLASLLPHLFLSMMLTLSLVGQCKDGAHHPAFCRKRIWRRPYFVCALKWRPLYAWPVHVLMAHEPDTLTQTCVLPRRSPAPPTRVRENLHVVLAMSPIGESFRNRTRMYPGLVNCTTIDWFQQWPADALVEVATKFIQDIQVCIGETTG